MDDQRSLPRRSRIAARLGAEPGTYAVASVVITVVAFAVRLFLDRGDPIAEIAAGAGLNGAIWALFPAATSRLSRTASPPCSAAHRRRGALVGLGVGVPFYAALILLCVSTGREWPYTAFFATAMLGIIALASVRLRARAV
ncbi:hypothetical protein [Actinoplanes sp. OR16]|uniref:hypothetical protein n=1 Tax=Actinoplanes sp. OR16 TaxID=946334 RepID=UPI000FD70F3E|nr:hypothetical protein [Actinoplanes sp. OR16]